MPPFLDNAGCPIKIGLIGCGTIAATHARALKNLGVEFTAISRTRDAAEKAANRLGTRHFLSPWEAAFDDPTITAVYILTPHDSHVPLACRAIEAGKHVFLEKPVARTSDEVLPLAQLMQQRPDRIVHVGEDYAHAPGLLTAAGEMERRGLTGISSIQAATHSCVRPSGWRLDATMMGGGALIDGGIHLVRGLRMLAGEVRSVFALEPARKWNQMEGESAVQALLRLQSGATALLSFSWDNHANPPREPYLVLGTEWSMKVNLLKKHITIYTDGGAREERIPTAPRWRPVDLEERFGFPAMTRAFLEAISTGRADNQSLAEGVADLQVIEAIYESLRTRTEVQVAPHPPWLPRG